MSTQIDALLTQVVDTFGPVIGCQIYETVQTEIAELTNTDLSALQAQIANIQSQATGMQELIDTIDTILDGNDSGEQSAVTNIIALIGENASAIAALNAQVATNTADIADLKNGNYDGADGASYYDVWLAAGNTGTINDMILAHKGDRGDVGATGASAYQAWLAAGNTGSEADFLNGLNGTAGASAYQTWLSAGNTGSEADFLNGLKGTAGASAYQTWLSAGNTGSEADFLASLVGADGQGLDASQYYTKTEVDALLADKVDTADIVTATTVTVSSLAARLKESIQYGISNGRAGTCDTADPFVPASTSSDTSGL